MINMVRDDDAGTLLFLVSHQLLVLPAHLDPERRQAVPEQIRLDSVGARCARVLGTAHLGEGQEPAGRLFDQISRGNHAARGDHVGHLR
ncbi:hypothetical protein MRX96_022581 [Rhipicephalus microplus]